MYKIDYNEVTEDIDGLIGRSAWRGYCLLYKGNLYHRDIWSSITDFEMFDPSHWDIPSVLSAFSTFPPEQLKFTYRLDTTPRISFKHNYFLGKGRGMGYFYKLTEGEMNMFGMLVL